MTSSSDPVAPVPDAAPRRSFTARLYRGEVGLKISEWRRRWFLVTAVIVLVAVGSVAVRGFSLGIEFVGGNSFQIPASVGTLADAEAAVGDAGARVFSAQRIGGTGGDHYLIRTAELSQDESLAVKNQLVSDFGISSDEIADELVSAAWGTQVTQKALLGLMIFLALVIMYLAIRFEWRMAVSAVGGLFLDLVAAAGVYSLVGFEVTPATIIGFLTIMGFGLYDTVVVFDKIHENTRGITASATQTYDEAADLAVNQTLMRSINTSVVALLPVGGLLFIGAGLLGAGTLKDLGLVLFVGMAVSFYASLFLAAPLLMALKSREPKYRAHAQRVRAKRAALANRQVQKAGQAKPAANRPLVVEPDLATLAGAAPKVGARPTQPKRGGARRRAGGARRR